MAFLFVIPFVSAQDWWNSSWNSRIQIILQEHSGYDRQFEPVYINLYFGSGKTQNCTKEIRVVTEANEEIPSQIYNESYYNGYCISTNIIFQANVSGSSSKQFFVYYENKYASEPEYESDLNMSISGNNWIVQNSNYKASANENRDGVIQDTFNKRTRSTTSLMSDSSSYEAEGVARGLAFENNDDTVKCNSSVNGFILKEVRCIRISNTYIVSTIWRYYQFTKFYDRIIGFSENVTPVSYGVWIGADIGSGSISGNNKVSYTKISSNVTYSATSAWCAWDRQYFLLNKGYGVHWLFSQNETLGIVYNISVPGSEKISLHSYNCYTDDRGVMFWIGVSENYVYHLQSNFSYRVYIGEKNPNLSGDAAYYDEIYKEAEYYNNPITFSIGQEQSLVDYILIISVPQSLEPNKNFSFAATVRNATNNNPVTNLVATDFSVQKEGEQIGFGFTNLGNGSYSLLVDSGNLLGNISFRICAKSACEEKFVKISVTLKDRTAFIASEWLSVINSGLLGKPLFRNYSDTTKYFLGRQQPEQVFTFNNIITNYQTYWFKNISAMIEMFFSGAILVKTNEQALAAAPLAKLKNYGILFEGSRYSGTILNLTDKTSEQITDLAIKEAGAQGKNINTIIFANQNSRNSELVGLAAVKYDSIIIPLSFPQPNYPASVNNFSQINQQNGVIAAIEKINQTAKKLNDNGFFANNWDYKLGKQLNLILIGNRSEVPHAIVFDAGNEWFLDKDSNYILTDYLYSDLNKDGKADIMTGRIISEYQLLSSEKQKKIVTAALYRNLEFAYSGNGLIESMSTDTAFRTAGFSAVRLIENHTSLSYYNISAISLVNAIGGFLKEVWKAEGIVDSLGLLFRVYGTYEEFLEHNLYKLMNNIQLSWSEGIVLHFFPDEKLEKERLRNEMQAAEGVFYYGIGNETAWLLPDENNNYKVEFGFDEFPILNMPFVYNEYDKAMRGRIEKIFEKGAAAIAGPTGIVHGAHAFAFNSKFTQNLARNKTAAKSVDNAKFLTQQETKNLTQIISFGQTAWPQPSLKQYLQTVLYAEPEFKIDPNYTEYEQNPEVSYNGSFVARIRIPVNYTVLELNGTKLILFDAEQQLQEFYKPVIPVYTKEFLLPNGSQVLRTEVNYTTQGYTNVFVPIAMPDEYYQQENRTQEGFYPDKNFENQSFELLDGRKSLLLTAMPLRYNNQTKEALVFSDIEFIILYTSPLDMLDFSAKNITLGKQQKFFIRLKNIGNQKNITIAIEVSGETIFESNEIGANEEKSFSISWKPKETGYYVAKAFVLFENNSAGPRYASFSVAKRNILETMGILPSRIFEETSAIKTQKIYRTALEKLSISKEADGMLIEYSAPGEMLLSKINATTAEKIFVKDGYRLEIFQQNGLMTQKITTAEGSFSAEKDSGAIREKCKGDCEKMKSKLASAIAEMNSMLINLQEKIK